MQSYWVNIWKRKLCWEVFWSRVHQLRIKKINYLCGEKERLSKRREKKSSCTDLGYPWNGICSQNAGFKTCWCDRELPLLVQAVLSLLTENKTKMQKCLVPWPKFPSEPSKLQEHTFSADGLMRMHWEQLEMKMSSAHTKRASRECISQIENASQTKHGEVLHQPSWEKDGAEIMALPICSLTCKSGITTLKDQESGWGYRPQCQLDFNHWFPQNILLIGQ